MEHFEEYKKQGEPEKSQKAENWGVAIGLQQVDNLTPSKYLIEVAKDNIEGKISIDEMRQANRSVSITKKIRLKPSRSIMKKKRMRFLPELQNF